jgi:hypothetical protein
MTNSRKKTPIRGMTKSCSDKQDKRFANRRLRRAVRSVLDSGFCIDDTLPALPALRELSDVWGMSKDGKKYFDKDAHPELMRK